MCIRDRDKALRNGETEKAEELQKDIDVLRGVLKLGTVPVVMKRAAELAGIAEIGPARKPVLECSAQDDEKIKEMLQLSLIHIFNRWLADADLEDIMKYKNPLLIKIFFSSNIDIDKTMRLLEKYIRECSDIIDKMNEDLNKIPEFEAQIHKDNESFYWGMTMTYGFMYYQNEIKWANWCIDKLKEKIG